MDDIAVVGLGLRFPGNATSPEELWSVLERGESQWSEFPKDRLNIDGYYHPGGDRQGSISFRGGHFIKGDHTSFDAPFFSVATEDAKAIDPQQRILLEASYEALENAGIRKEDIDGSDTAVYVGSFVKDYEQICLRDPDWQPQYAATGNGTAIMSNRISYFFNLHGPSMTIDTGCSGSLVSIHLAAQSLRSGESSLAIAAGAGMILTPNTIMPMTALNFLSPDGKCFTFDARANGYGRGEGIGVVVLKRMSDAIRDNDTIRAVIRGTKVNQDGHTTGITLPSKEAQAANIRSVYKSAGLDFNQTAYVECHGTGTQAGDWRELKAISESLGSTRTVDNPIVVGSVKPNIGHLEGAAGVAGLIKSVLTLEHAKIPPNINFQKGNPDIDFKEWKVKVPRDMLEWPLPGLRRVSVNCFGFGGTNAHVILDEAPGYMTERGLQGNHNSVKTKNFDNSPRLETPTVEPLLFLFSSHEKAGVRRVMESHVPYLKSKQNDLAVSMSFLRDYSYTLGARRSNLEWKHAIVAKSLEDLLSKIGLSSDHDFSRTTKIKQPNICFVFSGQGAQFAQMGKNMLCFPIFRDCLTSASKYMKYVLGSPFDLLDEILKDPKESHISNPEISQPATTALQVALVTLLKSFSIVPKFAIGHSSGEIAAAVASGAISRETAWEVAYSRGFTASTIRQKGGCEGAMIAVGLSSTKAEAFIKQCAWPVEIACINSPRSVTLSCTAKVADSVLSDLSQQKIFCRRLPVTVAYHSSHMKLVADDYKNAIAHITTSKSLPTATMFSSVTGAPVDSADLGGHYWVNNMVSPVQYMKAVKQMMSLPAEVRPDMIIELSPRAALKTLTLDIFSEIELSQLPSYYAVLEQSRKDSSCLEVVGALWMRGCSINMKNAVSPTPSHLPAKCLADIPPYPWNHTKSYWHESHLGRANRFREFPRQDLIGAPTADSISLEPRWRGFFRISENPWLQDHQVQKTIIYPAAGMVAMVLQGATQLTKDKTNLEGYEITNMRIDKAMVIPTTAHGLEMAMNFKQESLTSCSYEFAIYSKQLDGAWEQHARGAIQAQHKHRGLIASFSQHRKLFNSLTETCNVPVIPRQLYELLDINISEVSKGYNACTSKVRIPDTKSKMPAKFEYPHLIHPATLDSMFQTLFAINNEPMVPTFIGSLFVSADVSTEIGTEFTGYATASRVGNRAANVNIAMTQTTWDKPSVIIDGLQFTKLSGPSPGAHGFLPNHHNLCTKIVWKEDVAFAEFKTPDETIDLLAHKYPALSILQIGGSELLAQHILRKLVSTGNQAPRLARYTVDAHETDSTSEILSYVKGTVLEPFVEVRPVNSSTPLPDYHLILLCNDDLSSHSSTLLKRLKPDGIILEQRDGKGNEIEFRIRGKIGAAQPHTTSDVILLLPNNPNSLAKSLSTNLTNRTRQDLFPSKIMSEGQVYENIEKIKGKVIISLLDFANGPNCLPFLYDCTKAKFDTFHALQKSAKGIIWITKSAHMKPLNPKGAPMVGLARTLMSEDPLKMIVTFDLGSGTNPSSHLLSDAIVSVMLKSFIPNKESTPRDLEYAEEGGKVYIPRLLPINRLNKLIEEGNSPDTRIQSFHDISHCIELQIPKDDPFEDGLLFAKAYHSTPEPDEVEIIFESATINHIDLEVAMGHSTDSGIGHDMIGRIERIGDNVSGFESGDEVVALVRGGAILSKRNVDCKFVRKWTSILPLSQSISAAHCLRRLGRLGREKTVLIHAGASSHGLCAVQVASRLGAEVFVTIMGPNLVKQRAIVECSGIKANHILEADSGDFTRTVKNLTGGKGLDMVYNSTQQHIEANFSCVRKGGIILQFESKSPCPPSFRLPPKPVSVINFDFAQLLEDDPKYVVELLDETLELLKKPGWKVTADSQVSVNSLTSIQEALSFVQENPYLGIVSINGSPQSDPQVKVAVAKPTRPLCDAISKHKTYLLAGGLGGLGRSICELIIRNNARHIAFLSRSGSSGKGSQRYITELRNRGVDAKVFQVDICDASALEKIIVQIRQQMPPIAGVFQCAAVIKDAVFDNMNHSDWVAAMKPKTIGSDNLTTIIPRINENDPFFIFLSSSAGVIGSRGQANYASGNCFEDALALKNRILGKQAVSIDLGPVLDAGMLADDEETLDKLRASGFHGIRHQDFLTVISHAITMEIEPSVTMPPQVILGVGTGGLIQQNNPADPYWSRTALYSYLNLVDMPPPDLSDIKGPQKVDMKSMLACCADSDAATEIVCTGLSHMLAKAMNMLPEEIDTGKPPNVYGVDSLVAVGVRNWVASNCGVVISVFEVLSDKTVAELAAEIARKGNFGVDHD
ncbi:hypothetical protein B0J13DRAFT_494657 [Dactylonectria estremocensis]|uniref:Carrier domain-containing protein n=1 Tax=Dactylonectria estremocensis TaxID=1079267 RepID=A0A9P9F8Z1_9HYPO|nr:hypothetical protein B0J13DRAFT_494657 [Dactylonectria estremocensis]